MQTDATARQADAVDARGRRHSVVMALASVLGAVCLLAPSASASTFANPTRIGMPTSGSAFLYPSPITVSGLPGGVVGATASVHGVDHGLGQELDALLVAPNGAASILFSDVCGQPDPTGGLGFVGDFTFDDAATGPVPDIKCVSGRAYRPTDAFPGDVFPAPAAAGPHTAAMANFAGAPANGTWTLFVRDEVGFCGPGCPPDGVSGAINGGWRLNLLPDTSCARESATVASHVGTAGADEIEGTRRADVIIGLGGDDEINGGRGDDIICGGGGNDTASGEKGEDRLRGGPGRDRLRGGTAEDRCKGGKGKDRLSSC